MGREIRRVALDWEHPRDEKGDYRPIYDENYETAIQEWINGCASFQERLPDLIARGCLPEAMRANPWKAYAEWEGSPPDPESYRMKWTAEPTAYQLYETVTEGTPLSPVCATREAMIDWLIQRHPEAHWPGLSRGAAERFVTAGSAPSLVSNFGGIPGIREGIQIFEDEKRSTLFP